MGERKRVMYCLCAREGELFVCMCSVRVSKVYEQTYLHFNGLYLYAHLLQYIRRKSTPVSEATNKMGNLEEKIKGQK